VTALTAKLLSEPGPSAPDSNRDAIVPRRSLHSPSAKGQRSDTSGGKQPYLFASADDELLMFAGWDTWRQPDDERWSALPS
jgi:hypothetical protein